jgi:hypothetical protein
MWKLNILYRGIEMREAALPLLFLLLFSEFTIGQTTYNAPTGSVAPTFVTSLNLQVGGSVTVYPNFGTQCYYPGPCGSSYASFNYSLPDGSTAYFNPVASHFVSSGTVACVIRGVVKTCPAYTVTLDTATAVDSQGRSKTASVKFDMHTVKCTQPKGTCPPKKVYDNGSLTVR